jgi:hypothetical protein
VLFRSVNPLQNEFPACRIEDLARDSIEMKTHLEAPDISERKRKKVKEEGALGLRSQRDELALLIRVRLLVHILQVCGLSAQAWTIIDDLAVNLSGSIVYKGHLISTPT